MKLNVYRNCMVEKHTRIKVEMQYAMLQEVSCSDCPKISYTGARFVFGQMDSTFISFCKMQVNRTKS
jgi:hypothetical protein